MAQWQTPKAATGKWSNSRRPNGTTVRFENLEGQADLWQTPAAFSGKTRKQVGAAETENLLPGQAEKWQTPDASAERVTGLESQNSLARQVRFPHGRQDLDESATGPASSSDAPNSRRRLNPAFVEWLQGLPLGWTDCGRSETPWSRWWRLMRCELSRLGWESSCD